MLSVDYLPPFRRAERGGKTAPDVVSSDSSSRTNPEGAHPRPRRHRSGTVRSAVAGQARWQAWPARLSAPTVRSPQMRYPPTFALAGLHKRLAAGPRSAIGEPSAGHWSPQPRDRPRRSVPTHRRVATRTQAQPWLRREARSAPDRRRTAFMIQRERRAARGVSALGRNDIEFGH